MLGPELVHFPKSSTSCWFGVGGGGPGWGAGSLICPWKLFAGLEYVVPSPDGISCSHMRLWVFAAAGPVDQCAFLVGFLEQHHPAKESSIRL